MKIIFRFFTPAKLGVLVVAFTLVVGVSYLMQINVAATKGYKIKDLEKEINQLRFDNKKLNLQYIELQSMANVVESAPELNLVASEDVEIITSIGSMVALR